MAVRKWRFESAPEEAIEIVQRMHDPQERQS
jgi:hypothetical protein